MSDQKEVKIVTREETFNDLAVRELAKGRSACICRLQFGRCKKEECARCAISRQYESCYKQLSDYDKLRLTEYVSEEYLTDSLNPEQWMGPCGYVMHTVKFSLIMLGAFMIFAAAFALMISVASMF